MSEINALNPAQPDGPFRVMVRYKRNNKFEIFDEYTDRYTAEDVAKDLVTGGHAVEAEVIRVGGDHNRRGEHNRRRVVTYSLVKGWIERKSGNNVTQTIGSIEKETTMKSDADHEKALAEMRERQRVAALDREIAMQALGNLLTEGGKGDRPWNPRNPPYIPPAKQVKEGEVRSISAAWDSAMERVVLEATYHDGKSFTAILRDPDALLVSLQRALTVRHEFQYALLLKARAAPANRIALRPREVAEQIGASSEFVRSEIKAGRLKASKTKDSGEAGGAIFILVEDVYSWLRERSEPQS
jgi:hypothetical protein